MNNIAKDILCQIIKTKNVKAFNEFSKIELDGKLVVESYNGSELRVFNRGDKTHLMFPKHITTVQEGTLADAIESGALFDDANAVDAATTYAVGTSLPLRAMSNKGIEPPKGLINLVKPVIGTLDDNCHAQCGQIEIDNGSHCVKDICHTGDTGNTVSDVMNDYLGTSDEDEISADMAKDIVSTEKELRSAVLDGPEDTLDEDDYDEVEIEEGFFSMLSPDTSAKLIYHLNTLNDIINNPMLPDTPVVSDKNTNVLDETATEAKQASKMAAKCAENGKFDKRTTQLLALISSASGEMAVAADTISNPFLKPDDIMYNEPGTKEAVDKWSANKATLQKVLPEAIKNVEAGMGKEPIQEGFFNKPKRLKDLKMRDTVTYITLEISDIRDVNDAQILSGYVCSKLEITDFYISCLDNNDPKYIVPHTRQQLVQFQNDLNRLLTQILKIRPVNRADRTWMVNVNYPEGWRG
jgi:hypothetical protein